MDIRRQYRLRAQRHQRVAHDLAEHLHQRVSTQIEDVLDTGQIAGVPAGMLNQVIIGRLLAFVAFFWEHEGGTKQEFITMCDELFDAWLNRVGPAKKLPRPGRAGGVRVRASRP